MHFINLASVSYHTITLILTLAYHHLHLLIFPIYSQYSFPTPHDDDDDDQGLQLQCASILLPSQGEPSPNLPLNPLLFFVSVIHPLNIPYQHNLSIRSCWQAGECLQPLLSPRSPHEDQDQVDVDDFCVIQKPR